MSEEPLLRARDLTVRLGDRAVVEQASLDLRAGELVALVGPNGAGKTTLMRCIAALETPSWGTVTVDGIDVQDQPRETHRRLGFLSDFFGLDD